MARSASAGNPYRPVSLLPALIVGTDRVATLQQNMLVRRVVPVSLGDNVGGYRIVGTSPEYGAIYGAWWDAIIPSGGPEIVRRSAERYGRALREVLG